MPDISSNDPAFLSFNRWYTPLQNAKAKAAKKAVKTAEKTPIGTVLHLLANANSAEKSDIGNSKNLKQPISNPTNARPKVKAARGALQKKKTAKL